MNELFILIILKIHIETMSFIKCEIVSEMQKTCFLAYFILKSEMNQK